MLTFLCTCIMKLMLRHVWVGCGVGGGDVNVHVHLHHEVDANKLNNLADLASKC